jgi:hypothetical protein
MKHVHGHTASRAETLGAAHALVAALVDVMRRRDPAYAASHAVAGTGEEEWEARLAEAEDWLEDAEAESAADEDSVAGIAAAQGWTESTVVSLLGEYVQRTRQTAPLAAFLRRRASAENGACGRAGGARPPC